MKTHWLVRALALACLLGAASAAAAQGPPAVEVHGWILTRYYHDVTVDATLDESGAVVDKEKDRWLEWERISLIGLARLAEGRQAYGEIYIHPWLPHDDASFLYLESLYLDVPAGEGAKYRIGKGRSLAFGIVPTYGNRKTSNYGPLSETFTMDRALGVQYLQTRGQDSVAFGIFNSQRPGVRLIGMAADSQLERGSVPRATVLHLTDRDSPAKRSGELEASLRWGRQMGDTNVGLSGRLGAIDGDDAAYLSRFFANYSGTNHTRVRYGLDATHKRAPYFGSLEYYAGAIGGIQQDGYAIVLGVEPTPECPGSWRDMSRVCKGAFVRYTKLNIDTPRTPNSITWDTQQWAVSYVLPLKLSWLPHARWLQFEYERNRESPPPGASQIPNDLLFVELFTSF